MKIGDKISVRTTLRGRNATTKLPVCSGIVTEIHGRNVVFRYCDDAEIFAGLRGLIRLRREESRKQ